MRQLQRQRENGHENRFKDHTETFSFLGFHLLVFRARTRRQMFSAVILWPGQQNPAIAQMRGTSAILSLPTAAPFTAHAVLRRKEALKEALQNSLNKSHKHGLARLNMSFLLLLEKYTRLCHSSHRFYKTSDSSIRWWEKNIAQYLFLVIWKTFRIGIHSHSARMVM